MFPAPRRAIRPHSTGPARSRSGLLVAGLLDADDDPFDAGRLSLSSPDPGLFELFEPRLSPRPARPPLRSAGPPRRPDREFRVGREPAAAPDGEPAPDPDREPEPRPETPPDKPDRREPPARPAAAPDGEPAPDPDREPEPRPETPPDKPDRREPPARPAAAPDGEPRPDGPRRREPNPDRAPADDRLELLPGLAFLPARFAESGEGLSAMLGMLAAECCLRCLNGKSPPASCPTGSNSHGDTAPTSPGSRPSLHCPVADSPNSSNTFETQVRRLLLTLPLLLRRGHPSNTFETQVRRLRFPCTTPLLRRTRPSLAAHVLRHMSTAPQHDQQRPCTGTPPGPTPHIHSHFGHSGPGRGPSPAVAGLGQEIRRRPTLPGPHSPSTIGAGRLNFLPLRCFQRLSLPQVANQPCPWRDNWHTRAASIPVLSYWGQLSSNLFRLQRIGTELSHDVLNPARVPL